MNDLTSTRSVRIAQAACLVLQALFGPLRRRIQVGIDRRFYRSKYDAAQTLAAFGERLRDEVDLTHLSQELTSVVHETLLPSTCLSGCVRDKVRTGDRNEFRNDVGTGLRYSSGELEMRK